MKRPNITPGPWQVTDSYTALFHNDLREEEVFEVNGVAAGNSPAYATSEAHAYATSEAHAYAIAALPDLLAALEEVQELIKTARQHFPKSVKNADRFKLELTSASISKALHKAGYEFP